MKRIAAALCALALGAPALADVVPATAELHLPPFRPGPVMTFQAEERVLQTDTPNAPVGTGRKWTFDLQVISVNPGGGAVVRYVLRDFETAGAYDKGAAFWSLQKGAPIEISVDSGGTPQFIANFDAIKARFLAHYPVEASVQSSLLDPVMFWMAGMREHGTIAPGRTTLSAPPPFDDFHHIVQTMDLDGVDAALCQAKIERTTTQTIDRPTLTPIVDELHTTEMISTVDSWPVTLDERSAGGMVVQHTLKRLTPAGCGTPP